MTSLGALECFTASPRSVQVDDFLRRQPGMEGVARALARLRPLTKELMTDLLAPSGSLALITHTDFWCNNLLFHDDDDTGEEECAVLDWQMATYSRPTNDVALLLLSSLPTQLRRDNETVSAGRGGSRQKINIGRGRAVSKESSKQRDKENGKQREWEAKWSKAKGWSRVVGGRARADSE